MEEKIKELEAKIDSLTKFVEEFNQNQVDINNQVRIFLDELVKGDDILKNGIVSALEITGKLEAEVEQLKKK
ncbi:hypothetical protein [Flavobacterium terrisoli]|uniref:hypothetical protein n=1 Tax=Flavobacterium terrisoli TaxID=3242195 RepID=UPI0025435EC7|nr:hypothetical protein [Flavobacterium buctense]